MPVIGLNYTKILAERGSVAPSGPVQINTSPQITDVEKTTLKGMGKDLDVLRVGFSYRSNFKPAIGSIEIEGNVVFQGSDSELKDALKHWKKEKKLPQEMGIEVINHIFRKVSVLGLQLSDALQLPPIIGVPRLKHATGAKGTKGAKGTAETTAETEGRAS